MAYQDIILAEQGLSSYWKMDNNWNDSKGTNHGVSYGGATFGVAKHGSNGGYFDGIDDYIKISKSLASYTEGSIEMWISPFDFNNRNFIQFGYNSSPVDGSTHSIGANNNRFTGYLWTNEGGAINIISANTFFANIYHHVVLTWKDNNYMKLYVGGAFEGQAALGISDKTEDTLYIGSNTHPFLPVDGWGKGLVDEVAIYNIELSAATILSHYGISSAPIYPQLERTTRGLNRGIYNGGF